MAIPVLSTMQLSRRSKFTAAAVAGVLLAGLAYGVMAYQQDSAAPPKNSATIKASSSTGAASGTSEERATADKLSPAAGSTKSSSQAAAAAPSVVTNGMTVALYSGSVTPGGQFSVRVYENSGSVPVNAVQVKLGYDPASVELVSVDPNGPFPISAATTTNTPGTISLARGTSTPQTGTQSFTGITFRVKPAAKGSVELKVDSSDSFIVRAANATNILQTVSGASLTIKNQGS